MKKLLWINISVLAAFSLLVQGHVMAKNTPAAATGAKKDKVEQYRERLEKIIAPVTYSYNPLGKPDPFCPFLRNSSRSKAKQTRPLRTRTVKPPEKCSSPLDCIEVGQLTLVAVVMEPNGNAVAMAQDASGIGYTLKKGMKIGYRGGRIVAITPEKVIIREKIEDLKGNFVNRNRVLYLHPEEQK